MEEMRSGLVVSRLNVRNTVFGEILAIGENDQGLRVGDTIVFREFSGGRWSFLGEKTLITPMKDILATFNMR